MPIPASTLEVGQQYVSLCKEGKFEQCLELLFSPDAVSIEAGGPPGMDLTSTGLDAIVAKGKWWREMHSIQKCEVFGPYPNADRFVVRFLMQVTNTKSNQQMTMDEAALFTVANGKIVKEEFFYRMS
jgi:hypothetical protein